MPDGYLSLSATVVLQAVANGYGYGFDVMDATGLPSGTVYPALRRMEASGLVRSKWEHAAIAQREQRPPRKYYEVTRSGQLALADAVERYRLAGLVTPRPGKPSPAKS
jgi:PadR family transcriptional regulator, regulatory protein PadR